MAGCRTAGARPLAAQILAIAVRLDRLRLRSGRWPISCDDSEVIDVADYDRHPPCSRSAERPEPDGVHGASGVGGEQPKACRWPSTRCSCWRSPSCFAAHGESLARVSTWGRGPARSAAGRPELAVDYAERRFAAHLAAGVRGPFRGIQTDPLLRERRTRARDIVCHSRRPVPRVRMRCLSLAILKVYDATETRTRSVMNSRGRLHRDAAASHAAAMPARG